MSVQTTATSLLTSIRSAATNIGEQVTPLGNQIGTAFSQARQYANEKMGNAEPTPLPPEYKELEERVDKIRILHEQFLKATKPFTRPTHDYEVPIQETITELAGKVTSTVGSLAQQLRTPGAPPSPTGSTTELPQTQSHALARTSLEVANTLGTEEPTGAALLKFAKAQNKIGEARLKMDSDITTKFYKPFNTTLKSTIEFAMKARKQVQAARLNYDACKQRAATAPPARQDVARAEVEKAEDEFVAAVEGAMDKMKAVVSSPEPLRNLADLAASMLSFYKDSFETLSELSPELDELLVTNEALLKST
ncbi:hypothetical protein M427DRAFT_53353 [Gonapodya prolifera JEL478]|uniref:BAR domain-containing protein n=1 Tax=Gonapodya prolifera (strain JEL478) TaxID=1344416 RepID=A0A139AQ67_GONPJ|nr:hypothetical protein M427DRAFT_53353 [Gonapodya prolifera JEL478]|eukprot:KXS18872.1 hypothetical protein M427DRAFT_53353 [Gonapodya prolifera JEL478]